MNTARLSPGFVLLGALWCSVSVSAQQPGHGFHPPMPDQRFYFQCRLSGDVRPVVVEEALRLATPSAPAKLDQVIRLPGASAPIRLMQYLPAARLEQKVVKDGGGTGKPAIKMSIDGPTQSHQRWLLADDPQRNRLTSLIGAWRYMSVADASQRDELWRQFEGELTRRPALSIGRPDGKAVHGVAMKIGERQEFEALGCSVRVRKFFPHYGMNLEKKEPVNQSDKRINPAVLLEIEFGGKKEERWVFAMFPDFKSHPSGGLPVRVRLDCPIDRNRSTPDFVILTIGRTRHEIWSRIAGKTAGRPLVLNGKVKIAGSQYTFHVNRFVPSGRLVEEYRPADGKAAVTALQIEFTNAGGVRTPTWLQLGKERMIATPEGTAVVAFGPRPARPAVTGASGGDG